MQLACRSVVIVRARVLFVFFAMLAVASPAWAQVQFDTAVYGTPGPGTTCPAVISIGANANRALIVGVHTGSASVASVSGAGDVGRRGSGHTDVAEQSRGDLGWDESSSGHANCDGDAIDE
jgi:hypothetical protein